MVNSPLIRPYFLGGSFGGGTLNFLDDKSLADTRWCTIYVQMYAHLCITYLDIHRI